MADEDDFLDAIEADNKAGETTTDPKVEPPKEPAPKGEPEAPAQEPLVETPPEPPLELDTRADGTKAEPGYVPLGALLDTRDKAQAAEARAKQLEQELAQFRAQQEPQTVPDMFEDPEGYQAAVSQQIARAALDARLNSSEDVARSQFDDATVDAARDWALAQAQANPAFGQQLLSQRSPYIYAVREHQRVTALEKLGNDTAEIDHFLAWKAAQAATTAPQGEPPPQTSLPPKSIASAPSAGSILTEPVQSDEEVFNEVFP